MLRSRGLRMTPQRQAVIDALHGNDRHPTAEMIWERVASQMPMVSQKTVYQALNDLVELGEVQAVSVGSGAVRFDPNVSDHGHFVCHNCARVYDVSSSIPQLTYDHDSTSNASERNVSRTHQVDTFEVIFRGVCSSCRTSD
jgi:Fur family transcriptional regulator, peroxide stress response regulator